MISSLSRMVEPESPVQTSRVHFAIAGPGDDDSIRRLLRLNPMNGTVRLTFEREPDYFRSYCVGDAEDRTIVAYEGGRLVCMGRDSVRKRFVNGRACRVGYLGELRLDATAQGRFDILRRGYRFFRQVAETDPPALWFTSIASDNHRSRRFLERNLPGMPRYDYVGEFVTLLVAVPRGQAAAERRASSARSRLRTRGLKLEMGLPSSMDALVHLLNENGAGRQFAGEWTSARLQSLQEVGLRSEDWLCLRQESEVVACAALWDQRGFRQTVIRGYNPPLSMIRPFINLFARVVGGALLPPIDTVLAHAFLSPAAVQAGCPFALEQLVELTLPAARRRGLDFLTLGLSADDASLSGLRRSFRCREYRSRLYQVSWKGMKAGVVLDGRPVAPDVALL